MTVNQVLDQVSDNKRNVELTRLIEYCDAIGIDTSGVKALLKKVRQRRAINA
ncbi:hypothetical protein PA598K_06890 [Paenibacillus sp. 598K]|uniref:hypothetical protein n=1 Tax=Paenibacillus sp. 598K TaxID=1117987 RepID=UPI000FF9BB38|nr:hypothetical protein [Paenibacillus sp. 598K]GBF78272.1 hypothetical protein PA598K_06890 [Paenibacillus sp. 598K]